MKRAKRNLNVKESHPPFNLLSQFGRKKCNSGTWWLAAHVENTERKEKVFVSKKEKEKFLIEEAKWVNNETMMEANDV